MEPMLHDAPNGTICSLSCSCSNIVLLRQLFHTNASSTTGRRATVYFDVRINTGLFLDRNYAGVSEESHRSGCSDLLFSFLFTWGFNWYSLTSQRPFNCNGVYTKIKRFILMRLLYILNRNVMSFSRVACVILQL